MRARRPDRCGYAVRDGVRLYWELSGSGAPTVFLLPSWSIVDSRLWKLQVPYLARHFRVLTADQRGNGRSDRPPAARAYLDDELAADAIAVLDAAGVGEAVCVGLSLGARVAVRLAATHPGRVRGLALLGAAIPPDSAGPSDGAPDRFDIRAAHGDLEAYAQLFFGECFPERHSSQQLDDAVGWALGTDIATLTATQRAMAIDAATNTGPRHPLALARVVRCPALVLHGDDDRVAPHRTAVLLADALGAPLITVAGGGHCVNARHPVMVNLALRRFVESVA